jgi:hypothetical protein
MYVCNSNLNRFVVDYFSVFVSLLFAHDDLLNV